MTLTILNLWKFIVTVILALGTVSLAKSAYDGRRNNGNLFPNLIASLAELTAIFCMWGAL